MRGLTKKDFTYKGKPVSAPQSYQPKASTQRAQVQAETPPVGTVRTWLALDDFNAEIYDKDYTLRGVGEYIEVWVANDIAFPEGDCRRQVPSSTEITDAHVASLVHEFDTNMYPKEVAAFSTPPDRDGTNAAIPGDFTGGGEKTVALIDNVRDDNYYDFPANTTYIAGFFFSYFNEVFDRNVMTVDAFDWLHRTGANPPDEPTDDVCTSRPARPYAYESTFAHEWQHLQHYYTDPFEGNWINEGLSDYAQSLTGYADGNATVFDPGADSHLYCFQGFGPVQTQYNPNPRDCGGPGNSLTLWGDSDTPGEVLADYGNAWQFMLYLHDRFGPDILTRLHNDGELQGMASLTAALEAEGVDDPYRVLHNYQTSVLVDKIVGDKDGKMLGVAKRQVTSASVRSTVNLANPDGYDTPGAAPNGADYVALRNAEGTFLKGRELRSLSFRGAATLPALPLAWTVVSDDEDRPGNPVLWSGDGENLDNTAVTSVAVPSGSPTLSLLAKYGAEEGYDYGYVVVSTDGGTTYTPIAGDKTVDGPLGPALNKNETDGFEPHTFDLSAYAGQTVLLGFRYVSDGGVNMGGLKVDDVTVGGTVVSDGSSLAPFDSPTEVNPTEVFDWSVRLVGIDEKGKVALQAQYNNRRKVDLTRAQLAPFNGFPTVVAIVAYDEPTEQVQQYAPYTLTVNGVVQPGG
ncbi:peptidase M6 immune inhibitor A [Actinomycetes bacterium KLBMP 9797]